MVSDKTKRILKPRVTGRSSAQKGELEGPTTSSTNSQWKDGSRKRRRPRVTLPREMTGMVITITVATKGATEEGASCGGRKTLPSGTSSARTYVESSARNGGKGSRLFRHERRRHATPRPSYG